jgi:hypothetical protein
MQTSRLRSGLLLGVCALAALGWTADLSGYSLTGRTWGTNSVLYYVNPQNARGLTAASIVESLQRAANIWSDQSRANIALTYAGTTGGGSFTLNYKNEVFFRNEGGSVASTYWWSDGAGRIVDFDMALYDGAYTFYPTNTTCSYGIYIDNVAVHEFGHGLGLNHSSVAGASMYPSMSGYCDLTQLTLDGDDIAGVEAAYPPTTTVQTPQAPAQTAASRNTSNPTTALNVTWSDSSTNESGFRVERSTNGSTFSQVAQLGQNATSFVNSGLTSGVTYYYRVYAYNASGNSGYSPVASAQTDVVITTSVAPTPTSSLSLNARGYKVKGSPRADLAWAGASSSQVDIYRNGSKVITTANDGSHTDSLKKGGGTYQYKACNAGTTTCSNIASVTF